MPARARDVSARGSGASSSAASVNIPRRRHSRRARRAGWADGHSGSVTVVQRFGSGLQLDVHGHALVLDGVFTEAADGTLRFHPAPPPTDVEVARLVATIRTRVPPDQPNTARTKTPTTARHSVWSTRAGSAGGVW
jgi:Putative transposase